MVYAKEIGNDSWTSEGYFSVDLFLYARCCAVANGRTLCEEVLATPEKMPKDLTFEALLYLPTLAYERRTEQAYDYIPAYPMETYSNQTGWNLANRSSK